MSNNKSIKWKRFTRSSYAVFNSLHKEVAIGVLSAAMLQSAGFLAKANAATSPVRGYAMAEPLSGQGDDIADSLCIALGDVEVVGTRVPLMESQAARMVTVLQAADIATAAVHSINDLLEYAVGIDVRQRGEMGVQTDIAVRGGTFDQVTLLINGVNISSPHTGHLSADFPFSPDDIERIEVMEGPAARVFGTSAFTGVVNIVTKDATSDEKVLSGITSPVNTTLHLRGGAYGYGGGDIRLGMRHAAGKEGQMSHSLSGGYSRSDGATPNSFYSNTHLFYNGRYDAPNITVQGQAGYSYKPYGANTFYGLASTDQWESNERFMASLRAETTAGGLHIAPQAYWNRWLDHYQWHRNVSPGGENFHLVDVYGLGLNSWFETALGKTSFGIEMRSEAIWSTNLGKALEEDMYRDIVGHDATSERQYTKHDQRTNISAFLEHNIILDDWTFSLGVLANHNTGLDGKWRLYPGIDISYRPTDIVKLFASWNMALRMPTFTDLYYSGTNIEGSSNLMPEKTNDVSVGTRIRPQGWDISAQAFYSHKSDMIDWVVYTDETVDETGTPTDPKTWIYRSGNFTLDNWGIELQTAFMPREKYGESFPLRRISASYAWITEDMEHVRAVTLSKYAQEYLRHKVVVQADGRIWNRLNLSLSWRWQERTGTGNSPYALLDGRLSWDDKGWSAYIDCSNILDKEYYDYSIVRQPGRWIKGGVILRL